MFDVLKGKKIILGVCGSIAAYKACGLVRLLKSFGAEVKVAMTPSAQEFVNKRTFEVLSDNPVFVEMFAQNSEVNHVEWVRNVDALLIAPVTANTLAKLVQGFADDAVSSTFLMTQKPVLVCPAMHTSMWNSPAVLSNVEVLKQRGVHFLGPEIGKLSMGDFGEGRLIDEMCIVTYLSSLFLPQTLVGRKFLVTAGPTYEAIDKVRYISNHSSGKMAVALVNALYLRGAALQVVSSLKSDLFLKPWDDRINFNFVRTAEEMLKAVDVDFDLCDTYVSVAAVADFKPKAVFDGKLEKGDLMNMELTVNDDILAKMATKKGKRRFVGFVLDPTLDSSKIQAKIQKKSLDVCVAVTDEALGSQNIKGDLYFNGQKSENFDLEKSVFAAKLADMI